VFILGKIKINLKVNGIKTWDMEMEVTFLTMVINTLDNMSMENLKDLVSTSGPTDQHIPVILKQEWNTVKGNGGGSLSQILVVQKEIFMKAHTLKIKSTEWDILSGRVVTHMQEITKWTNAVGMALCDGQMEAFT